MPEQLAYSDEINANLL